MFLCRFCGEFANPRLKGGGPSLRIKGSHDCRGALKKPASKLIAGGKAASAARPAAQFGLRAFLRKAAAVCAAFIAAPLRAAGVLA